MTIQAPDPVSSVADTIKVVAIVLVFLLVFGLIGYLVYTKSKLESQVADDRGVITALQSANQDWKTQTDSANAALKKLKDDTAARAATAATAETQAQAANADYLKAASNIEAAKPKGDDCAASKALLDNFFKVKK